MQPTFQTRKTGKSEVCSGAMIQMSNSMFSWNYLHTTIKHESLLKSVQNSMLKNCFSNKMAEG